MHFSRFLFYFLSILIFCQQGYGASNAITVSSEITPPTLRLGDTARYRIHIEISGDSGGSLSRDLPSGTVPRVSGLDIHYLGNSTRTQSSFSTLGEPTRTSTLTLNYRIQAREPGTYSIPEFSLLFRGAEYRVPKADVHFLEPDEMEAEDSPPLLFLELLLPEEKIFIGQKLKASLQLYALEKIPNLRNHYPIKIGDAWAEGKLADSQTRSRGIRDGYQYDVYSRTLTLTPIKSGPQDLLYEMEVQALLPVDGNLFDPEPPSSSSPQSIFNDPFFQQFNFRKDPRMEYQNLTVPTEPLTVEVHPLPSAERPASFTGAIGAFTLRAFPSENRVRVGDPLKLRLQLAGQGNFDRILAPQLELGSQWKIYEPESSFRPGDSLGFSGVLHFDFTLIPLNPAITHLPELSIAYFDPKTERYEELTTAEIPITILENPHFTLPSTMPIASSPANDVPDGSPLFLELDPGKFFTVSSPLLFQKPFLIGQSVPLMALITFVLLRQRQIRRERDHTLRRRQEARRKLQVLQAELPAMVRQQDLSDLYSRLLHGFRLVLSIRFGQRAEAATRQELEDLLQQCPLSESSRENLLSFFKEAESFAFSGQKTTESEFLKLRHQWESLLQDLERQLS